jgi:hypothetical protein
LIDLEKSGDSGDSVSADKTAAVAIAAKNFGESAPPDPPLATIAIAAQVPSKKDKQLPKKRKGEAEKLLEDQIGRSNRRSTAKEKVFSSIPSNCVEHAMLLN